MDMEKKSAFLSKRRALKGNRIYLDDLIPTPVATCKENMPQVLEAKKEGKKAIYRDGKVTITKNDGVWPMRLYTCLYGIGMTL